ncbi:hypothetical protein [Methylobacterium pseudosasicola]|uniref:Uncharacterized protein n=1 Tax=Methylobacterium pseudosasicola TaxID=582667 RepID=A0A1I4MN41_9HYPH|nr:hypothetical protein [Methylobacterium pseudosasicola]SFM04802.1 hypothetical protein SAMN05192568_101798 [Methylobacterium pseudosasicola]
MPADGGILSGPLTLKSFSLLATTGGATGTFIGFAYIKFEDYVEAKRKAKAAAAGSGQAEASTKAGPTKPTWSRRGKSYALEMGLAGLMIFVLVPETDFSNIELKSGAHYLLREIAEHYPSAKVSLQDCVLAMMEFQKSKPT